MSTRQYVILNADEVSIVNFDEVLETSPSTLSYSLDGSQTFVKYEGNKPRFLYGKDTYTHSQIVEILAGEEWTDPNFN
jgi:hypothetical protein